MEKMTMTDSTIAFIGLGLIGGSIARAIRKTRPDIRIMAYMRSRSRLEQARKEGIVDVILDGIDENLRECDLIFLCTPVEYNAGYLSAIRPYLKQGALITDVGSTKCGIHEEIRRQGLEYCFVGGHPMAGSKGIIEGKTPWLHLVNADCTVRTGKALAEIHRLTAAHIHHHQSAAQGHDCLYGICKPFFNTFLYNQTVHHDFNVMLDVLLQPDFL